MKKKFRTFDGVSLEEKCRNWPKPDDRGYVTLTGVPVSVATNDTYWGLSNKVNLAAIVNVDGQPVLGYVLETNFQIGVATAVALLQSEIAGGGKESITMSGFPSEAGLSLKELKVRGYTINFR